jgi:hypothetical protein
MDCGAAAVRANLVYRAFARIGVEAVPDAKTILKIAGLEAPARGARRVGARAARSRGIRAIAARWSLPTGST